MADGPKRAPEIMVIEDEPLIAMYIEDVLTRSGFTMTGPFETVAQGSDAARRFGGDAALVDLTLQGDDATIILEILASRNIPFVVMTGREQIPGGVAASASILKKPFLITDLLGTLHDLCIEGPR
jgi:DNA-binding response OmpR family regulator